MRNLYNYPIGTKSPEEFNVIIEVPTGSNNKYEYNAEQDIFELDRVLFSSVHYPGCYGFIPQTLGGDGDPLDVVVLTGEPMITGSVLSVRPVGFLKMTDDKGQDEKILAVPVNDPRFNERRKLSDVRQHVLLEIEHFFRIYKELEKKFVDIDKWYDVEDTKKLILEAHSNFKK
jgi:inorganic pyrophosphatase|tara:strand:+ start:1518 stop:2036 length:519 start_codon:yes stop_codon:yes gene_type:complete